MDKLAEVYPGTENDSIKNNTIAIAKSIARTARADELDDLNQIQSILQLSLLLGPHMTLDEKLREAASDQNAPLGVVNGILKTARIAELYSFGRIADDRIKVIETLQILKDSPGTLESEFQKLLTEAPWLINPEWSPITANRTFTTLREEFKKFYKARTDEDLILSEFTLSTKRADFVMSSQDNVIQIVEIKPPDHAMSNEDMERLDNYVDIMEQFLKDPVNELLKKSYPSFHVTLVCDRITLSGVYKTAFEGRVDKKVLTNISWRTFLLKTKQTHEQFLREAERQKQFAAKLK